MRKRILSDETLDYFNEDRMNEELEESLEWLVSSLNRVRWDWIPDWAK